MTTATQSPTLTRGEAGRLGPDVRSDLWVSIDPGRSGGIRIDLRSRVAALYGDSIRDTVRATLAGLGVKHARVIVDDQGALPFVIAARVEAAARRAGVAGGDARPERTVPIRPLGEPDRLRRSRLYLPGGEPKFMVNAVLHGADGIILDLEDSVHPGEKDSARILVRNALRCVDFGAAERMVRINQHPLGLDDLDAIVPESPDLVLIPKVESPEQVAEVGHRIRQIAGTARPVWLMPIVESAIGVERAFDIARADPWIVALTIGLEDYTADLGVARTPEGVESRWARERLVVAARAAGVQPIDSVWGDVADMDGLRAWGLGARSLGFEGMGCIHPRQIQVIHEAFAPTPIEIEKALRIEEAWLEAESKGLGVVSLGSRMIDPPVVARARRLLALARRQGLIGEDDVAIHTVS